MADGCPAVMPDARLGRWSTGLVRGAQDCVRTVLATPGTQAGRFVLVEAFLCDAQIAQRSGEPERALEILIRALDVARGEVVLPFLRMKDTFAVLRSALTLTEPLTNREHSVLRWLSTTMSTREIADELCLSVNTVKTHVAAIYRKLPATRRREAVLRARQLELI